MKTIMNRSSQTATYAAIATCVLTLASSAQAVEATATATQSAFTFSVADLNGADGIAAGVTVLNGTHGINGQLQADVEAGYHYPLTSDYSSTLENLYQPVTLAASEPAVATSFTSTDSGFTLSGHLADGKAHFLGTVQGYSNVDQLADGTWISALTVTPHTQLMVTSHVTAFASAGPACPVKVSYECATSLAQSMIEGGMTELVNGVAVWRDAQYVEDRVRAEASSFGSLLDSKERDVTLVLTNDSDNYALAWVGANMWVSGDGYEVPAVPEPSSYMLMLGGLIVLTGAARRVRRGASASQ